MAEELCRKWRKEDPKEWEKINNMTSEELNAFLKSKGFQFTENSKESNKK